MPGKVIQFQIVTLEGGTQVTWILTEAGQLWYSNPTTGGGAWQLYTQKVPDQSGKVVF